MSSVAQPGEAPAFSKWVAPVVGAPTASHAPVSEESIARLRQEAREAGFAEGRQAGMVEAKAVTQARLETLEQLISHLNEPLAKLDSEVLQTLVELALSISRVLVSRELALDPSLVLEAVSATLAAVPDNSERLKILVNPADLDLIAKARSELGISDDTVLLADSSIAKGGALVESGSTVIDAQLETRLNTLLDSISDTAMTLDE